MLSQEKAFFSPSPHHGFFLSLCGQESSAGTAEVAVRISSQGQGGERGTLTVSSYIDIDMYRTATVE